MSQLWLLYPELGSCIHHLGWFLGSNNLAQMENMEKSLYGPRDNSIENMSFES